MPQEYQDPIAGVIQGLLQGHQVASQIKHQKLQEQAFARSAAREEREAGISDIMQQMHMRDIGATQVQNGMIEETRPDMTGPGTDLGGGVSLPGSSVQGGTFTRKAKGAITLPGANGSKTQWELPTPEAQIKRKAELAQQAKTDDAIGTERAHENMLNAFGVVVPDDVADATGYPRGTKVLARDLPALKTKAGAAHTAGQFNLGDGVNRYDANGKLIASNEKDAPLPTGDFQQVYLPAFAKKRLKTVDQLNPDETVEAVQEYAQRTKDPETTRLAHELTQARLDQMRATTAAKGVKSEPINPGSREYRLAQDVAYGRTTMATFRGLFSRSEKDTNRKMDVYDLAGQLNPQFNSASFEMGFTLAKNPKVQQQLASMDNVMEGVSHLLKFSDDASRSGVTAINKFIVKGGIAIGGKKYSDFKTAQIGFADELSGALGFGSATDMSRQMGIDMTNENLSPDAFRSAVENVVVPFIQRKRDTLLKQMGPYGMPGMNPAAPAATEQPAAAGGGHVIQINGKNYKYGGSGATDDMKNYTEVKP